MRQGLLAYGAGSRGPNLNQALSRHISYQLILRLAERKEEMNFQQFQENNGAVMFPPLSLQVR